MNSILDIQQAIANLRGSIRQAHQAFIEEGNWYYTDPAGQIEDCFLKLIAVTDAMGLTETNRIVCEEYNIAKASQDGFMATEKGPDDHEYSACLNKVRQFLYTIEMFFPPEKQLRVTTDLLEIIRNVHYTITDKKAFCTVPQNEQDVHLRIEGILKPIFPDLKHKPVLTKPIKNFEPDTGIPSLQTLIEYKFLSKREDVAPFADQILADTRGYTSKEWRRFIYVVYETNRFRPEREWNDLLQESGVLFNTTVVVLSGEPKE